jgi:endonuclease/exonuclease/phosphatase family metal-dependent hydrolase
MAFSAAPAPADRARIHPFAPEVVNLPPRPARSTLKLVLLNARGGAGLDPILACLQRHPLGGADVIMLCEVDVMTRRANRKKVAHEIAEALGMSMVYQREFGFPRVGGAPFAFMGNALLCTQPLEDVSSAPIANLYMRRQVKRLIGGPCGIVASAMFNRRRITLGVAHLNSRWEPSGRAHQIAEFLQAIPSAAPALLAGDLNTTTVDMRTPHALLATAIRMLVTPRRFHRPERYEPLFQRLSEAGFTTEGANVPRKPTFTFSRIVPPVFRPKLDWITARGLRPVSGSARVIAARRSFFSARFSDHDFLTCEFEL